MNSMSDPLKRVTNDQSIITVKINWCKIVGHKWKPVSIKYPMNSATIELTTKKCSRCDHCERDVQKIVDEIIMMAPYGSYGEVQYHETQSGVQIFVGLSGLYSYTANPPQGGTGEVRQKDKFV